MKYVKRILSVLCLMSAMTLQANAALITQELIEITPSGGGGPFGSITINTDDALIDPVHGTGEVLAPVSMTILGTELSMVNIVFFQAIFDTNNLYAGLEFLNFDISVALFGIIPVAWDGYFDAFGETEFNYFSLFNISSNTLILENQLALGKVSVVSEPATLAIFGLMLGLLGLRRKLQS